MVIFRSAFPVPKKVIILLFILFFIFSILLTCFMVLANQEEGMEQFNGPPIDNNSPSVTLQNCLKWYEDNHPTPIQLFHEGECKEIVGYRGNLAWTAVEGLKGRLTAGCETWQKCYMTGTIGESTDETIELESFEFQSPDARSNLEAYDFKLYGFVRCTEPVLRIEPEKKGMLVGEWIHVKVYLDCGYEMCLGEPVILEVVSGPGELELPELSAEDLERIWDSGYFLNQDNIIVTHPMIAKAMLHATEKGTIEIKATYDSCRGEANQGRMTEIVQVNVGECVEIECTYQTDPERFGDSGLQWGGTIHCEACLEVFEEEQFGMKVRSLKGYAHGTQDCWVKVDEEYSWIENKKCPAFTGVIDGAIWDNVYTLRVSIDDSAALTFDICSGEKSRPQRLTRHEWDPVNFIGVPIHLDASDPNAVYIYEEESDIIGTQYKVVSRWQ